MNKTVEVLRVEQFSITEFIFLISEWRFSLLQLPLNSSHHRLLTSFKPDGTVSESFEVRFAWAKI